MKKILLFLISISTVMYASEKSTIYSGDLGLAFKMDYNYYKEVTEIGTHNSNRLLFGLELSKSIDVYNKNKLSIEITPSYDFNLGKSWIRIRDSGKDEELTPYDDSISLTSSIKFNSYLGYKFNDNLKFKSGLGLGVGIYHNITYNLYFDPSSEPISVYETETEGYFDVLLRSSLYYKNFIFGLDLGPRIMLYDKNSSFLDQKIEIEYYTMLQFGINLGYNFNL